MSGCGWLINHLLIMSDRVSEVTRDEYISRLGGGVLSPLSPPLTDRPGSPPLPGTRADIRRDPPPVEKWRTTEINVWLAELGFSQYETNFDNHCIYNGAILMQLTEEHLDKMGIRVIGHFIIGFQEYNSWFLGRDRTHDLPSMVKQLMIKYQMTLLL